MSSTCGNTPKDAARQREGWRVRCGNTRLIGPGGQLLRGQLLRGQLLRGAQVGAGVIGLCRCDSAGPSHLRQRHVVSDLHGDAVEARAALRRASVREQCGARAVTSDRIRRAWARGVHHFAGRGREGCTILHGVGGRGAPFCTAWAGGVHHFVGRGFERGLVQRAGRGLVQRAGRGLVQCAGRGLVQRAGRGLVQRAGRGLVQRAGRGFVQRAGR
eukprot:7098204-Prymnesium_polylepis.1